MIANFEQSVNKFKNNNIGSSQHNSTESTKSTSRLRELGADGRGKFKSKRIINIALKPPSTIDNNLRNSEKNILEKCLTH